MLEIAPDYLDARLGLARLDYFDGAFEMARTGVLAVLAERPGDADAMDLLAQIDRAIAAAEAEKKPPPPPPVAPAVSVAGPPPPPPEPTEVMRWRLDLNGGWSELSGGRPDWWEADARIGYQIDDHYTVSLFVDWARRFNAENTLIEGRVDYRSGGRFGDYLFVSGTPGADFPRSPG